MVDRRYFLAAAVACLVVAPGIGWAQQGQLRRIALMAIGTPSSDMTESGPATFAGVSHLLHEAFLGMRSVLLLAER
jgi:hypothetical protein